MRRLRWGDSPGAVQSPRIRVERFCSLRTHYRVHLLSDIRFISVHFRFGENTVPCLAPDACPYCADPVYKSRIEAFAPAMVLDQARKLWVPIVAVFTSGGAKKLLAGGATNFRGRVLDVWRVQQGTAGGGVLHVKELNRVDPCVPAFDVEPHLMRLWFPGEKDLPPAEIPDPVAFVEEPAPHVSPPKVLPFKRTAEERAALREAMERARKERERWAEEERPTETPAEDRPPEPEPAPRPRPAPEPEPEPAAVRPPEPEPAPASVPVAVVSPALVPEDPAAAAMAAERDEHSRRLAEARAKPSEQLTVEDAILSGRTLSFVAPGAADRIRRQRAERAERERQIRRVGDTIAAGDVGSVSDAIADYVGAPARPGTILRASPADGSPASVELVGPGGDVVSSAPMDRAPSRGSNGPKGGGR